MILTCNYEEITALTHGAQVYLEDAGGADVLLPTPGANRVEVEALLARLGGYLSVRTLEDQRDLETGIRAVVQFLREVVDSRVLAAHPADEEAVSAYFDFAHALSVLQRVIHMGEEMTALVELMGGGVPGERSVREFVFPD